MIQTAMVCYVLAQLADVYTTERALRAGAREANPVVKWLMEKLGRGWIVAKLLIASLALAIFLHFDSLLGIWVAVVVTAWVAWHNMRYY